VWAISLCTARGQSKERFAHTQHTDLPTPPNGRPLNSLRFAKNRTVILSTHIVSDIESIADQVIMFKDHKLLCCDSPGALKGDKFNTLEDVFMHIYGDDEVSA